MLKENPSMPLDNRFGEAGCARRIENPQRMIKWDLFKRQRSLVMAYGFVPGHSPGERGGVNLFEKIREQNGPFERRQSTLKFGNHRTTIKWFAIVLIAVNGKEYGWLNLLKAIDNTGDPEVRRATRPDGADAGTGQEGDERLGNIPHISNNAVSSLYSHLT